VRSINLARINSKLSACRCGIAFCPICDKAEESCDQGEEPDQAVTAATREVRKQTQLKHRIKDS
jgi:hypothetical protein